MTAHTRRTVHPIALLTATVLFLTVSPALAGPDPAEARRFISDGIVRSVLLFNSDDLSRDTATDRIGRELQENFDVRTIAAYALGNAGRTLTEDQKRRYLSAFQFWVGRTVTRFVMGLRSEMKTASPDMITVTGTSPVSRDQILVHSKLALDGSETAAIDWRLRQKGDRFLILDMLIVGVSQLQLIRSQFEAILGRDGATVESLISELEQRNAQLASR